MSKYVWCSVDHGDLHELTQQIIKMFQKRQKPECFYKFFSWEVQRISNTWFMEVVTKGMKTTQNSFNEFNDYYLFQK